MSIERASQRPSRMPSRATVTLTAEHRRLEEAKNGVKWRRWGTYLSERQWGTVREDYSANGDAWNYFPHEHARSRAYRWGEDGLLGLSDNRGIFNVSVALWNGKDPYLKERMFGLTGPEGNHGETVGELYWYLDATPTGSYSRALYKYPQRVIPVRRAAPDGARATRQRSRRRASPTRACSRAAATSTSRSSTRRRRPRTSSFASRRPIADPRPRGSTCFRSSGSATRGAGERRTG